MDDTSFGLSESLRVLHQAGIRHVLPGRQPWMHEGRFLAPDWDSILAKLPPSPRVILTYRQLGSDLTGAGDSERSALWRRLFALLGLPKGTLGFLPYCFDDCPSSLDHVETFFQHLSSISPAIVLIFDSCENHPLLHGHSRFPSTLNSPIRFKRYPSVDALMGMDETSFKAFSASLLTDLMRSIA